MNVKIELCMGSSCFARKNSRVLTDLEAFIEENQLSEKIEIIGHLCMNNCSGGPVIRINDITYLDKDEKEIRELIEVDLCR